MASFESFVTKIRDDHCTWKLSQGYKGYSMDAQRWIVYVPTRVIFWCLCVIICTRWRHQMETFSALLPICPGNSPVPGEFPAQRPVTRSFDVFFDLRPNKRLSKQSRCWWFETPSSPLWRHCNDPIVIVSWNITLHKQLITVVSFLDDK